MGKIFFLFISFGFLNIAPAATGVTRSPLFFPGEKWGFRLESEFKSTYDKQRRVDGYESQTDLRAYRALDSKWGTVVGGRINQSDRRSKKSSPARLDEGAIGFRSVFNSGETKVRTEWTYNPIMTEEIKIENGHDGYFLADIRSNLLLSYWGKLKLRLKHWEYVMNSQTGDIETRQTKFEISPGYVFHRAWFGLKNQIVHRAYARNQENTYEVGPFIRYEGKHFEPLAKIVYRPVKDSPEFRVADNWSQEPVYSVEIELKF